MICRFCEKDIGGDGFVAFCRNHGDYFVIFFEIPQILSICKGIYEIEVTSEDTKLRCHEYIVENSPSKSVREYSHKGVYYGDYGSYILKIDISFCDLSPDNFDKYFEKLKKLIPFS